MDIKNFFELEAKYSPSSFQARIVNKSNPEGKETNCDSLILGNYNDINFPVYFKQVSGKKLGDLVCTGWPFLFLMSEKMKTVLTNERVTGWNSFPINLFDVKGRQIEGYYGLSIFGRCGPIDYKKSKIIEKRLVASGPIGKYYKGLFVDLNEWDGSDFFLPKGSFAIIVTTRAAETLLNHALTNISLKNLSEIEIPSFAI